MKYSILLTVLIFVGCATIDTYQSSSHYRNAEVLNYEDNFKPAVAEYESTLEFVSETDPFYDLVEQRLKKARVQMNQIDDLYQKAQAAEARGHFITAKTNYKKISKIAPKWRKSEIIGKIEEMSQLISGKKRKTNRNAARRQIQNYENLLAEAQKLEKAGKFFEAYKKYNVAKKKLSRDPRAINAIERIEPKVKTRQNELRNKADRLFTQGIHDQAIALLLENLSVTSHPASKQLLIKIYHDLATDAFTNTQYELAVKYFNEELKYTSSAAVKAAKERASELCVNVGGKSCD